MQQIDQLGEGVAVYGREDEWYWQRIPHWPHNRILCGTPNGPYTSEDEAFEAAPKE